MIISLKIVFNEARNACVQLSVEAFKTRNLFHSFGYVLSESDVTFWSNHKNQIWAIIFCLAFTTAVGVNVAIYLNIDSHAVTQLVLEEKTLYVGEHSYSAVVFENFCDFKETTEVTCT